MTATVVVTDGEQRAALAAVRSLGAAGYHCVVTAGRPGSLAAASRFVTREHVVPDALRAPAAYADAVVDVVASERASLLLPIAEGSMLALLGARARFGDCVIPCSGLDAFRALSDKERVLREARGLGIAVPAQQVLPEPPAPGAAAVTLPFPVVLKPARTIGESGGVRAKVGVLHASDEREFQDRLGRLTAASFPLLIQQRVDGPGEGVFLLRWDGKVRAAFAHRRVAEKPPWGGVSVCADSIASDSALLNQSVALLERFDWNGVAMVEYKRDAATGTAYLMEINGRFWGSLQLAIDAGVDFPRLLAACALGACEDSTPRYAHSVRSRWWWGEVDHVIARLRRRGYGGALPPHTAALGAVLLDATLGWLRPRSRDAVFRISDPRPFLRESRQWLWPT